MNSKNLTIEFGDREPWIRERVESGEYSTATEVIQAGLDALEREEAAFDQYLREKVQEALNDPRPDIPMDEVFERLERKHAARRAAAQRET